MDDTGSVVVVTALGAVLEESLNERARARGSRRVHDEACRLVDDEEVLVLPDDRDIERFPSQRLDLRDLRGDLLSSLEPEALGTWLAVDEDETARDQALGERAGCELGTCGEDAVEPRARLLAQERESGAVPTRGLARSAATNEAKSSPTPTTMNVSARLNAGQ